MPHKSSNDFLFQTKRSKYRNFIALCLKTWKKNKSIRKTAKILNLNRLTVSKALKYSKSYFKNKRKYDSKSLISKQLLSKNSPYRNKLAKCLNTWRKTWSLRKASKILKYSEEKLQIILQNSKFYRNRISLSKADQTYIRKWGKKIRAINILGGKCCSCKNRNIFVLEFHHTNEKTIGLNKLLNSSWNKILIELKKCKLLCRNCHQEFHHKDNTVRKRLKLEIISINKNKKCKCGYNKQQCLTFHHTNAKSKSFDIGSSLGRKYKKPLKEIIDESKKCELICHNCHKLKHINLEKFNKLRFLISKYVSHDL